MARLRGRARRGERCRAAIPHGHWNTTTFIAGLRLGGIAAPMLLPGPMDRDAFRAYVEKVLVAELNHSDTVIMDIEGGQAIVDGPAIARRKPAHKVSGIREMIEASGARVLFLPPYSPDFNPIEMAFSKLKALLRKAAARTKEELDDAIANPIEKYPADQCAKYFKACGYEPE